MRSCVKKPIKILMGNCFVKSNFIFSYLNKAAELENINAWGELVSLYQKGNEYVQPDQEKVKFYKEKINEYWKRKK